MNSREDSRRRQIFADTDCYIILIYNNLFLQKCVTSYLKVSDSRAYRDCCFWKISQKTTVTKNRRKIKMAWVLKQIGCFRKVKFTEEKVGEEITAGGYVIMFGGVVGFAILRIIEPFRAYSKAVQYNQRLLDKYDINLSLSNMDRGFRLTYRF